MIKYTPNKRIKHIQELEPHQMRYWYQDSLDFIDLFEPGEVSKIPEHYMNCKITERYIRIYYPETIIVANLMHDTLHP